MFFINGTLQYVINGSTVFPSILLWHIIEVFFFTLFKCSLFTLFNLPFQTKSFRGDELIEFYKVSFNMEKITIFQI